MNLRGIEERHQQRLPTAFKDDTRLQHFNKQLEDLNFRKFNIILPYAFNNLIIIKCGSLLKYMNNYISKDTQFIEASLNFEEHVEIHNLRSTSYVN